MRTEQIIAKALKVTGGDRYKLSLMTTKHAEELAAGATPLVENIDTRNMKFSDIAILELAEGKITLDVIIDKD